MLIQAPVYSGENGLHHIGIYAEEEDGTIKRTMSEPLRLLRDNIKGISVAQGELVSSHFDRQEREWRSPTVLYHYGRPQSFYHFMRERVARNQFIVFAKPSMSGRVSRFQLHELQLKPSTSQRKIALLKEKYVEAIELWSEEELAARVNEQIAQDAVIHAKTQRINIDRGPSGVVWYDGTKGSPKKSVVVLTKTPQTNQPLTGGAKATAKIVSLPPFGKGKVKSADQPKQTSTHFWRRFFFNRD